MSNAAPFSPAHPQILPLESCLGQSIREIGHRAYELLQLYREQVPLPETYLIPASLLEEVVHENALYQKLEHIFTLTPWGNPAAIAAQSQIAQEHILHARIPASFAKHFAKAYVDWMENEFFAVRPSFISDSTHIQHLSDLHVTGEVNIFESILKVWAKTYRPEYMLTRYQEWQRGQVVPAAVVLQRMVPATSAGFCILGDRQLGHSPILKIYSTWGVYHPYEVHTNEMDYFEVDVKSEKVLTHQIQLKKKELVHHLDRLHLRQLIDTRQADPSLSREQLLKLSKVLHHLSTHLFIPHTVEWAFEGNRVYILSLEQLHWEAAPQSAQAKNQESIPLQPAHPKHHGQYFAQIHHSDPLLRHPTAGLDGVIFESDHTFKQMGTHPSYLIQHNRAVLLKDTLVKEMSRVLKLHPSALFVYRAQNLSANMLCKLQSGSDFELPEENPYLGYHGGIRNVHNYQVFDLELDALLDIYEQLRPKIRLLLPFIRSSNELKMLAKHIQHPQFGAHMPLQLWVECSIPAMVLELEQYLQFGIGGVVFNLTDLHALLHGIDPNHQDIFKLYPLKTSLLQSFLQPTVQMLKKHNITVLASLPESGSHLQELAVNLGCDGVVIRYQE